jgi:hypothetical protein
MAVVNSTATEPGDDVLSAWLQRVLRPDTIRVTVPWC